MPPTITRICPDLPLCWEDEHTLRFGFDRAELRIRDPSPAEQRLISALLAGVRSDRLGAVLRRIGATRGEWIALVELLEPILRRDPVPGPGSAGPAASVGSVAVFGAHAAAERIRGVFASSGFEPSDAAPGGGPPGLIVMVERFLPAPAHGGFAFAKDPPRLTIRFGDRNIDIGPLASQPGDPCSGCVALGDADADPALPTLAAQLFGQAPASETAAAAEFAAGLAVALVRRWAAGHVEPGRTRYRVPVRDGLPLPGVEALTVDPHAECGCALASRDGSGLP